MFESLRAVVFYIIGECFICGSSVNGADEACQAMGHLYHTACFVCCLCGKMYTLTSIHYVIVIS